MIIAGKLYDHPYRRLALTALIAAINAAVHIENICNFLLCLIMIFPQIADTLHFHINHPR